MGKFITQVLAVIGFLTVVCAIAIGVAVALVWWQDRQWQKAAAREAQEPEPEQTSAK